MNKTVMVFVATWVAVSTVFAVDLVDVNLIGNPGESATNISSVATLNIASSQLTGGSFVTNTVTVLAVNGNAGINITDASAISITNSTFQGSDGGIGVFSSGSVGQSLGGRGIDLRGSFSMDALGSGVVAVGGDGGVVVNNIGRARSYGGDGFYINSTATYDLVIDGGSYTGGDGGNATFNSPEVNDPNVDAIAILGEFFGQVGGVLGARGGYGLRVYNEDFVQYGSTITINGGTFNGGDGGDSQNSNPGGDSNADGGHAIFTDFVDVEIHGGNFNGGAAGKANGVAGEAGYGVKVRDGNLAITGGSFNDQGLWFESHYYDSTATVSGGAFGHALFAARYDEFFLDPNRTTTTDISGGTFDSVAFMTAGADTAFNNATISGGTIGDLYFFGSVADSSTTVSLGPSATISGGVQQDGGIVNVELWNASHFQNTTILDGTMNFNNQLFTLLNGSQFTLDSETAVASFNSGLTVANGGVLDVGFGTATAPDMEFQTGSQIISGYDGTNVGIIDATGDLTINSGVEWTIDIGSNTLSALGEQFDIAMAGGILDYQITSNNITFVGTDFQSSFLDLINLFDDGSLLTVSYEQLTLDKALGVEGDTSTEYGKAVTDFSMLVQVGTPVFDDFSTLVFSADEAGLLITNSYLRTTEMAGALVGLQSVFSDQIKDRTRSHLRQQEVGYPAPATPVGSAGWDSMRRFSDRMEESFGADEVKSMVDAVVPDVRVDVMGALQSAVPDVRVDMMGALQSAAPGVEIDDITLPVSYRTWGRGYGSFIEQKTAGGFAGYDATIGGGVLGIDKEINNVMIGMAGGYARTVVEGYAGKDGMSDTGHAAVYFSAHGERAFLDANANYAYNDVETEYDTLGSKGDYAAHTVGLYLGGGYAITIAERVLLTPEASILSSFYTREAYTESADLYPDLQWDSYDQWSHLATVGATLSMIHKIDLRDAEVMVQPEVRAHWLHEFNDEFDDETYSMDGGQFDIGASLRAREEDLIKLGAGVRLSKLSSDTTEIGLDVDGTFGEDYTAYIVSGKIIHRF